MHRRNDELDAFKSRINLSEFAAAHGYILDRKASSRNSAVMRHGDGDKIVIALGHDQHWIFFSVRDPADHGTIIDFLQHRQRLTLGQVRQALRPWLDGFARSGSPAPLPRPAASSYAARLEPIQKDLAAVRARYEAMRPVEGHHDYLVNERAIPAALLASARFKGCVRTDDRGNAIFPHFNQDGLCGYEIKNRGFTGFASGGQKGLSTSNVQVDDNAIVLAETMIDALAYAALRGHDRARFFSIAGQMNPQQPALLAIEMKKLSPGGRVILAFDNDTAGDLFTAQVTQIYSDLGRPDTSLVIDRPPARESDWNDVLRASRGPSTPASTPIIS